MINFNLKEEKYTNGHPLDGKYGVIRNGSMKDGYPITIVDNSEEVVDGMYTKIPSVCLVHLNKDVRYYEELKVFSDFLYMNFNMGESTFHMYDYKKCQLRNGAIVKALMNVLYFWEPKLQTKTLLWTGKKGLENDPNYYQGTYVLNNEKEYTILKYKKEYRIVEGKLDFSIAEWDFPSSKLISSGEIDLERYEKALAMYDLKRKITTYTNQILEDNEDTTIQEYKELVNELKSWKSSNPKKSSDN